MCGWRGMGRREREGGVCVCEAGMGRKEREGGVCVCVAGDWEE